MDHVDLFTADQACEFKRRDENLGTHFTFGRQRQMNMTDAAACEFRLQVSAARADKNLLPCPETAANTTLFIPKNLYSLTNKV